MKCAARVVGEVLKGVYLAAPPTPTTIFSAFMRFSIIILPRATCCTNWHVKFQSN